MIPDSPLRKLIGATYRTTVAKPRPHPVRTIVAVEIRGQPSLAWPAAQWTVDYREPGSDTIHSLAAANFKRWLSRAKRVDS
jgi:hypothetical protein